MINIEYRRKAIEFTAVSGSLTVEKDEQAYSNKFKMV